MRPSEEVAGEEHPGHLFRRIFFQQCECILSDPGTIIDRRPMLPLDEQDTRDDGQRPQPLTL